jgi:head-tail adaptor
MSLAAGGHNRRIVIEARAPGTDAANRPNGAWTEFKRKWTKIAGATGMGAIRQADTDGVTRAIDQYSFRIRFDRSITDAMRVRELIDGVAQSQAFDILQVRHDLARREWTDIVCEVGGNDG